MLITTGKVKILKIMQKELLKKQEILQEYAQNWSRTLSQEEKIYWRIFYKKLKEFFFFFSFQSVKIKCHVNKY